MRGGVGSSPQGDHALVMPCSRSAVRDLLQVAWRNVGSIVTRVVVLTALVDHDSGVLL